MWFFYALFFAIWGGLGIIIAKSRFKEIPSPAVPFLVLSFALPSILLILISTSGIPSVTPQYFQYVFASGLLDSIAFVLAFLAIKRSDVSLIAPLSSFSPVLTTVVAIFALNEIPSPFKLTGIILVVVGAYLLNLTEIKKGILNPFKKLFSNKGVWLFLGSICLWAITPILQKKAILETVPQTPLAASLGGLTVAFLLLLPVALPLVIKNAKKIKIKLKWFILYGVGASLSQLAAYTAFSMTNVSYVTTIMRLESIVIIILGGKLLHEKKIKQRLLGTIVMVSGALIIAF